MKKILPKLLPLCALICTLLTLCTIERGPVSPDFAYGRQQIHGGTAMAMVVPTPDLTTVFRNPGVGLQSNLITETEVRLTATPANGVPIPNMLYRDSWINSESSQGSRSFTQYQDALAKARADLQCANVRMYMHDPGDGFGEPTWVRTGTGLSGWQGSHDDGCASTCAYSNWEDADNITALAATLSAFATAISSYPALCSIDVGWHEYNENNTSGSHYTNASATGISPTPIGGTGNEIPTPNPTAKANYLAAYATAFPTTLKVGFPDDQVTFDQGAGVLGLGGRQDGLSYRNVVGNPAATPGACGAAGVQMCTLIRRTMAANYDTLVVAGAATPTPIAAPTISYPTLWQSKPIMFEIWSSLSTWISSSWPWPASLKFVSDNHTSQINTKGTYTRADMEPNFGNLLKVMGYRHVIESWSHNSNVSANVAFNINVTWNNLGTSPDYLGHKVLFKFTNQAGGTIYKFASSTVANWLPNTSTAVAHSITLPTWVPSGTYDVAVGIGNGTSIIPETYLAITSPSTTDGWYLMSTATVTNGSPTAKPDTDFACGFASASSQYLELTDRNAVDFNATDFEICWRQYLTNKTARQAAVSKGDPATFGSLEYWAGYDNTADRFQLKISANSTIYTVSADNLGSPSTATWYTLCGSYDNSAKSIRLKGNNGTANTTATVGTISNRSQNLRVGADTTGNYANGRIDKPIGLKRLWTAQEETDYYNSGNGLRLQDMAFANKRGTYFMLECDEATSASRIDPFQNWTFTQTNGVSQVDAGVTQLD